MSTDTADASRSAARNPLGLPLRKAAVFAESIKIEHSIFALPFAYLTLFLLSEGWPDAATFGWITLAMFGGRTVAMAANRLIDAEIDARNPRTAGRAIPMGTLKRGEMVFFIAVALALFLLAVYNLSEWAQRLWPAALAPLIFYPYLKRFTWLCHFGLTTVYMIVPPAVWLAGDGELPVGAMLLGLGAGMWVAGFDVIYALQDIAFDRANRVHSIPARFGVATALRTAKVLHLSTVAFVVGAGVALGVGPLYYAGAAAFFVLLAAEHSLVSPKDTSRAGVAFFNMNGVISVVFFIFVMADVLVRS